MSFSEVFENNKDKIILRYRPAMEKVCSEMDKANLKLKTLSQKEFADVVAEAFKNSIIGVRPIRYALTTLDILYSEMKIEKPLCIKEITVESLSNIICETRPDWDYFKTIENVIEQIDKLGWGDFYADIKAACVLAWNGLTTSEIVEIKKSDINFENKTILTKKHGQITLSDFEIEIIKNYSDLNAIHTPIQQRVLFLVSSPYLFRPILGQEVKVTEPGKLISSTLRSKITKLNNEFKKHNISPRITTKNLLKNGDFYRVYTLNLSEFVLDRNRRIQYKRYLNMFWEEKRG